MDDRISITFSSSTNTYSIVKNKRVYVFGDCAEEIKNKYLSFKIDNLILDYEEEIALYNGKICIPTSAIIDHIIDKISEIKYIETYHKDYYELSQYDILTEKYYYHVEENNDKILISKYDVPCGTNHYKSFYTESYLLNENGKLQVQCKDNMVNIMDNVFCFATRCCKYSLDMFLMVATNRGVYEYIYTFSRNIDRREGKLVYERSVTHISSTSGIILFLEEDGTIVEYLADKMLFIRKILPSKVLYFKCFPYHTVIVFEEGYSIVNRLYWSDPITIIPLPICL